MFYKSYLYEKDHYYYYCHYHLSQYLCLRCFIKCYLYKKYHYYYCCNYHQHYYFPLISVFSITFACDHVQDLYKATKKERKVSHKSNCNTCCGCYLLFFNGNEFLFAIIKINGTYQCLGLLFILNAIDSL